MQTFAKANVQLSKTLLTQSSTTKLATTNRIAEYRAKNFAQSSVDLSGRSFMAPTPSDVTYTHPKLIATTTKKVPTQEEYLSYEMTDGEYDSDDEDYEPRREKRYPDWVSSTNLIKALEVQYSSSCRIDPDALFGEVETCNLEAIFNRKSSKYRHRNSSGDWTEHRVTAEEKRIYKEQGKYVKQKALV
jgi:Inner centromere protein, ARK binding region